MYFGGRMATRRWQIPLRPFVPGLNISPPLTLARPARKNQLEQVFFANSTQDEDPKVCEPGMFFSACIVLYQQRPFEREAP